MHPHIFVLRTDQPQPQQKGAEGERQVIPDGRFSELRVLLVNTLRRDRHSQNDVGFDFACVQRGVEQPPLDCAMVEHRMQVQGGCCTAPKKKDRSKSQKRLYNFGLLL